MRAGSCRWRFNLHVLIDEYLVLCAWLVARCSDYVPIQRTGGVATGGALVRPVVVTCL